MHYFGDDTVFQAFDYFGDSDAENALKASVVMQKEKITNFKPDYLANKTGSYAYYFLVN